MGATSFWVYGDKLKKFHFSHRRLRIDRFVDSAGKRCAGKRVLNVAQMLFFSGEAALEDFLTSGHHAPNDARCVGLGDPRCV